MAAVNRNGAVIMTGSGKHKDKRTKRVRTRQASERRAIKEQED